MIGRKPRQSAETEAPKPKGFDDFETRLGDLMRGERATLGKSLLDVQRELRIKAAYISAIENCDPSVFETPGFIAGYVRSYARYLGMDSDLVFQAFCEESGFATAHGMSSEASSLKRSEAVTAAASASAVKSDPLVDARTAFVPVGDSVLSRIEPAAVGSVLVLALVLGGIGYGGWSVLQEVQRVQLAPVEQTPIALSDLDPLAGAARTTEVAQVAQTLEAPTQTLDRLYRPQALDVPVLVARDGPISTLDPRRNGAFTGTQVADAAPEITTAPADAVPLSRHAGVTILAARPSWLQVEGPDGAVVHEATMNAGDSYTVAPEGGSLVVGRAGDVYVMVDGTVYGPMGAPGTSRGNIDLSAESLKTEFALAELGTDEDLGTLLADLDPGLVPVAPDAPVLQVADVTSPALPSVPSRPQVFENGQPAVTVVATQTTWVLIKDAAGARLFEAVLNAGDTYTVPQTENPPIIRTGNAGGVYFNVAGQTYGPYGGRGEIADNQQLTASAVMTDFGVADMSTQSEDVRRVVAELGALPVQDN
ncbi:helix-turn-helix domain-containing protein [Pseudaestuariivita sp.]|uniref:helix-turn-helix domain-containing protein n=1 Tax=Pseudaestuariivita sp. TaxID=2211669 RepID=UPI0040597315